MSGLLQHSLSFAADTAHDLSEKGRGRIEYNHTVLDEIEVREDEFSLLPKELSLVAQQIVLKACVGVLDAVELSLHGGA